ncbi:sensor domain-containing diguanylate cyclase [Pseudorhodoferax sp.]|uniref:sensor domain-containing diguanylate cyclase n=1 Tax=Pseudorhodoferax sp. TaxID=1993553 RepID=UPI002DD68825|nr:diguanylate cyclase [Pseudorhodoferax sp.]
MATVLDQIEVAMCLFDAQDRTVLWNDCFERYFPEHAGLVHAGEPYTENLRRFYRHRLASDELGALEHHVAEAVQRHRMQRAPLEFDHHGFRVRAASLEIGPQWRARVWRKTQPLVTAGTAARQVAAKPAQSRPLSAEVADALESIADGVLLVDSEDRVLWANRQFFDLLGVPHLALSSGCRADDLHALAWQGHAPGPDHAAGLEVLRRRHRFSGAPYELALPRDRWVRVTERRGTSAQGHGYFSYVDITALKRQQRELRMFSERLEKLAVTDSLTGLVNRRRFDENLAAELRRAVPGTAPLSLLMVDVDKFKPLNDAHGHVAGDAVLRQVAQCLAGAVRRAGDMVARYGGEEFAVLLPRTGLDAARALAERIRQRVAALRLPLEQAAAVQVTVSIGVCASLDVPDGESCSAFVERADAALYEAKRLGRNRVEANMPQPGQRDACPGRPRPAQTVG